MVMLLIKAQIVFGLWERSRKGEPWFTTQGLAIVIIAQGLLVVVWRDVTGSQQPPCGGAGWALVQNKTCLSGVAE